MKFRIKGVYSDGDEMVIREAQLDYDLDLRGYDKEHIDYIIAAIYEKVKRDGDCIEADEFADIVT